MNLHATESDETSARRVYQYQGPEVQKLTVETRFGWQTQSVGGHTNEEKSGFRGEFFNLRFDARLYKGLTFSWRQRLNLSNDRNFWQATDWMVLNYAPNSKWIFSGGKQIVAVGGYEYDRPPIDIYGNNSEYWNHIGCYQFGVSASYNITPDDRLLVQFCNSPFRTQIGSNNTYGFSLFWAGKHGMWETLWSVNAFQCTGDRWMNYIALGNKFNFMPNKLWLELDYVNRASSGQTFLFDDYSVIAELSGCPHSTLRIFGKYTYDVNNTGTDADLYVTSGTEMNSVSGGVEYKPFKKYPDVLRLHAAAGYHWGVNTNPNGAMQDDHLLINVGAKMNFDILRGLRWALKKK